MNWKSPTKPRKIPKYFFSYIQSKKNVNNNVGPLFDNGNAKIVSDDKGISFNLYSTFSNVFTDKNKADITIPLNIFHGSYKDKLDVTELYVHELRIYLQMINQS